MDLYNRLELGDIRNVNEEEIFLHTYLSDITS